MESQHSSLWRTIQQCHVSLVWQPPPRLSNFRLWMPCSRKALGVVALIYIDNSCAPPHNPNLPWKMCPSSIFTYSSSMTYTSNPKCHLLQKRIAFLGVISKPVQSTWIQQKTQGVAGFGQGQPTSPKYNHGLGFTGSPVLPYQITQKLWDPSLTIKLKKATPWHGDDQPKQAFRTSRNLVLITSTNTARILQISSSSTDASLMAWVHTPYQSEKSHQMSKPPTPYIQSHTTWHPHPANETMTVQRDSRSGQGPEHWQHI